jgi:hypothetical protein
MKHIHTFIPPYSDTGYLQAQPFLVEHQHFAVLRGNPMMMNDLLMLKDSQIACTIYRTSRYESETLLMATVLQHC